MRAIVLLIPLLLSGCSSDPAPSTPPDAPPASETGVTLQPVWGDAASPIRPGASLGRYCTFNFLYYNNTTAAAYIGTAGHCTEDAGERVVLPGVGVIGTVVYDSDVHAGADAAVDFSLIELDADRVSQAYPGMLGHDGPHDIYLPGESVLGQQVGLHGYGLLLGEQEATRDRSGVLITMDDRMYTADMPAVNGDSGSPLLHLETGNAVGIISHYGIGAIPPSTDEGPTMTFILAELARAGFPVHLAVV